MMIIGGKGIRNGLILVKGDGEYRISLECNYRSLFVRFAMGMVRGGVVEVCGRHVGIGIGFCRLFHMISFPLCA